MRSGALGFEMKAEVVERKTGQHSRSLFLGDQSLYYLLTFFDEIRHLNSDRLRAGIRDAVD
jgi:hypothetical protein